MADTADVESPKESPTYDPAALETLEKGGALLRGGNWGNRGGGRPRSAVREASKLAYDERIKVLAQIADSVKNKPGDRIRAIDTLGKHAGISKEEAIPRELVKLLAVDVQAVARSADFKIEVVGELTADEEDVGVADVFLSRVYAKWAMTLGAYRAGDI
jgi:hypothetical protein